MEIAVFITDFRLFDSIFDISVLRIDNKDKQPSSLRKLRRSQRLNRANEVLIR